MGSDSRPTLNNQKLLRALQILWIAAVLLNLIIISISIVKSYQATFLGEVTWDIHIEEIPDGAYGTNEQFTFEALPNGLLVTTVSDTAAEAGLRVGDILQANWMQGRQNMPLTFTVLSPDGTSYPITLIASDLQTGYFISYVSADAEAAGVRLGDMLFGDGESWFGEVGTEVHFMVLHEGETEATELSLIRKPFNYLPKILQDMGISLTLSATLDNGLRALVALVSFAMAILVFFNRSNDWQALFFAWVLTLIPIIAMDTSFLPRLYMGANSDIFRLLIEPMAVFFLLSFPTVRVYPRWSWLLLLSPLVINLAASSVFENLSVLNALNYVLVLLVITYRYRWYFNQNQRQQTKWLIYGIGLIVIVILLPVAGLALKSLLDDYMLALYYLIAERFLATVLSLLAIVFVAFAILRYRLYDIDLVINRTIVGLLVTVFLLLIFVPSVFLIQSLLGAENTLLSYAVSAAIPALLFQPARKAVRQFVDRRIYGFNFDLQQLRAAQQKPEIKNAGVLTGKHLGQYEVLDFIGKGGMGEVYKGYANGQTVALKTLPNNLAREHDFLRRFQREAEVMQGLEHPKIVKLHGSGESDGQLYLAMDFIAGKELKDYLREKGKLDLETAREILCDIADALDFVHGKNIVHRDIKPSNVMLRGDDPQEAILMDFGIAKIEDGKTRLTGSGAIGTIDYMAPEQIMAAKEVDKRADVYALGVIAYEMLTGERPFKGSAAQVMFAHLQQPVADPRQHNPNLSESLASALLKALEKRAEERFETAGDFMTALV